AGRDLAPGADRGAGRGRHHLRRAGAPRGPGLDPRRRRGEGGTLPPPAAVGDRGGERGRSPGDRVGARLPGTQGAVRDGAGGRRRLAALGEMRELGDEAPRAHREVGAAAAAARLDALFLLGPHAGEVRAGAEAAGLPAERITIAASHDELAARLAAYCRAGDLVLLKGSRGAAMEEVLRRLTADASGERRP